MYRSLAEFLRQPPLTQAAKPVTQPRTPGAGQEAAPRGVTPTLLRVPLRVKTGLLKRVSLAAVRTTHLRLTPGDSEVAAHCGPVRV